MKNVMVGNLVKWTFDNGVPALTFDCTKASGSNRNNALIYGFNVRLTRMAALSREGKNGAVINITEQMRHDAIAEGIAFYENAANADWNMRVARVAPQNATWLAIAGKRGISYDAVAAEMAQRDLDALAAL